MVAELVQRLLHLERERQDLDENGGLDRPAVELELVLGPGEDLIPKARLAVALELRQVEVKTGPALEQAPRVVEGVEPEVEERAGDGRAVDAEVTLDQVPAAGAHDERGGLLVELVHATVRIGERDPPLDRVDEIALTLDQVAPRRRVRVLEVGHVDRGARVQRIDDHLPIGRARDLDLSYAQVLRHRCDRPVTFTNVERVGAEVERAAAAQMLGDLFAPLQETGPRGLDLTM